MQAYIITGKLKEWEMIDRMPKVQSLKLMAAASTINLPSTKTNAKAKAMF